MTSPSSISSLASPGSPTASSTRTSARSPLPRSIPPRQPSLPSVIPTSRTSATCKNSAAVPMTAKGVTTVSRGAGAVKTISPSAPASAPISSPTLTDSLPSSLPGSRARTFRLTERAQASKGSAADSLAKSSASPENSAPFFSCLKMFLHSAAEATTGLPLSWKELATPQGRSWWELTVSGPITCASGYGLLPTVRAAEWKGCGPRGSKSHNHWIEHFYLSAHVTESGKLNPTFAELLMGFPAGWTEFNASAMPSSRKSRNSSRATSGKPSNN